MSFPGDLSSNPHFVRYQKTWEKNKQSIVFIPLAELYREKGLLHEAEEICQTGLKHHPDSVSGRLTLSRICFQKGNWQKAAKLAEAILQEYPGQKEAQKLREEISVHPGATATVRPKEQPLSLWDTPSMARVYAHQGDTKTALHILDRILAKNPQDNRALLLKKDLLS